MHAARLKFYRAGDENKLVPESLLELARSSEAKYELVERIHDIGEYKDGWQGLPDLRDRTWVSIDGYLHRIAGL